jgi:hypothetical protein
VVEVLSVALWPDSYYCTVSRAAGTVPVTMERVSITRSSRSEEDDQRSTLCLQRVWTRVH